MEVGKFVKGRQLVVGHGGARDEDEGGNGRGDVIDECRLISHFSHKSVSIMGIAMARNKA